MNVASLGLCKELYGLSGWKDAPFVHRLAALRGNRESQSIAIEVNVMADSLFEPDITSQPPQYARAYDLGYLIRRLPGVQLNRQSDEEANYSYTSWACETGKYAKLADTPEDAACKLAIELFNQGILTKEQ